MIKNKRKVSRAIRGPKQKFVEKKLSGIMVVLTLCLCLCIITINIAGLFINSTRLLREDSATTVNTAEAYAERVLNEMLVSAKALSSSELLQNSTVPRNTRIRELRNIARKNGYLEVGFLEKDATGFSNKGDVDLSGTKIAEKISKLESFVMPPMYLDSQHRICLIAGAPIYDSYGTGVLGMVYVAQETEKFNEKITSMKFGENGYSFLISPTGEVLFHPNKDVYTQQQNPILLVEKDKAFTQQAKAFQKMIDKKQGFITYNQNGESMYCAFKNMENFGDCIIVLCTKSSDFLENMRISGFICIGAALVFLIAALIIMRLTIRKMIRPVAQIQARFDALSAGDIRTSARVIETNDELGEVSQSLHVTIHSLRRYLDDLSLVLDAVATGNLTVTHNIDFKGDFSELGTSINLIITEFNKSLLEINSIIDGVTDDAKGAAQRADLLSRGANEQAVSVNDLSNSVLQITSSIQKAEGFTSKASLAAKETGTQLQYSNKQMLQMIAAMDEIGNKAQEIGDIIKTIEGIAFKTNLLALNAAIEAAHAGAQGRGFAVVANEVRALASKSALAARSTTDLITQSVESINIGVELARQTAQGITDVVNEAGDIVDAITMLDDAAKMQTQAVNNIIMEMENIKQVVLENSDTAANSAAVSESMMDEANHLKSLISNFKLNTDEVSLNTEEISLNTDEVSSQNTQAFAEESEARV